MVGRFHISLIRWAAGRQGAAIDDVGIDHRRSDVLVPKKILHSTDITARFEQVRREAMPEGVATDILSSLVSLAARLTACWGVQG